GTLLAQGKHVPVQLVIAGDGQGTLKIGDQPARPITDLGLIEGWISGDSQGDISSANTRRDGLDQLALSLKRRGDRIEGEIVAWRKTSTRMVMWPFWTELAR